MDDRKLAWHIDGGVWTRANARRFILSNKNMTLGREEFISNEKKTQLSQRKYVLKKDKKERIQIYWNIF